MNYWTKPPALWGQLGAKHFPSTPVTIKFEDGSYCKFEQSFFCMEGDRYVVYTEHCGYHSFPLCIKDDIEGEER